LDNALDSLVKLFLPDPDYDKPSNLTLPFFFNKIWRGESDSSSPWVGIIAGFIFTFLKSELQLSIGDDIYKLILI
jgi:hypothetical protein